MRSSTNQKILTPKKICDFRREIYRHYHQHGRILPWRSTRKPYHILVSEIMLQQTQVERVAQKYQQFITAFPDFETLSKASLRKILQVWQGMGYNRRALFLKKIAQEVVDNFKGTLPNDVEKLTSLTGIGKNTASAILAFGFNQPVHFIETNIRSVFIHCFFHDRKVVNDCEILPLVEKTVDIKHPREWYYALMDYGVLLKKTLPNPSRKSAHHQKHGAFAGSNRQLRGVIIKLLTDSPLITETELAARLNVPIKKLRICLGQLQKEGFIKKRGYKLSIT